MNKEPSCKYCRSPVELLEEGNPPDMMVYHIICPNCGEIDFTDVVDVRGVVLLEDDEKVLKLEIDDYVYNCDNNISNCENVIKAYFKSLKVRQLFIIIKKVEERNEL